MFELDQAPDFGTNGGVNFFRLSVRLVLGAASGLLASGIRHARASRLWIRGLGNLGLGCWAVSRIQASCGSRSSGVLRHHQQTSIQTTLAFILALCL